MEESKRCLPVQATLLGVFLKTLEKADWGEVQQLGFWQMSWQTNPCSEKRELIGVPDYMFSGVIPRG